MSAGTPFHGQRSPGCLPPEAPVRLESQDKETLVTPTPGRADLAVGVVLLACFYWFEWMLKRLPRSRLESVAVDLKRTGQVARVGLVGLARAAIAEGEPLDRRQQN
jgi:hypothetical protein